ncbi:uncharacterized protein KNAG_0B02505 [Huiozyma naganishii CBS 8797]|uniref:Uncharacterized protein n=1 Tax=Huiozyma naganishii (strain ATCC MYA-139 / BCRC 22969 / CBS 8797 / KCTC 17520 / NBRC 10181 / NCYC 3082 / Yp74L-3) TaxID=1071383 RepID=J7RUY7_HUIN7|nr:hypothetical protein KNAG_0B02505 [Kazachstania naganishii CBS 8797]CCK68692.1 hypothetical protein KNAG_0B02505 [Kazachstania naganishii CBS 8797]
MDDILTTLQRIQDLAARIYGSKSELERDLRLQEPVFGRTRNEKENEDPSSEDHLMTQSSPVTSEAEPAEHEDKGSEASSETDSITADEIGQLLPLNDPDRTKIYKRIDDLVDRHERIRRARLKQFRVKRP